MRILITAILLLFNLSIGFSQNDQLAQDYFEKGEFEKALNLYETLHKNAPHNQMYLQKKVACLQELQEFSKADQELKQAYNRNKQASVLVEIGYNYYLQKNDKVAKSWYDKAIDAIRNNPNNVYAVAQNFENKSLLEQAILSYEIAQELNPNQNFDFQKARLYGQMGNLDLMIENFLDYSYKLPHTLMSVQNQLGFFMNQETNTEFSDKLRKALLLRVQKTQDIFWNQFLSWFFVQKKEYDRAFTQEKAIYKRNPELFYNIVNLADLAIRENENNTAKDIFNFILENTQDQELEIHAHHYLMQIKVEENHSKEHKNLKKEFEDLFNKYGKGNQTLALQLLYAEFLAFYTNNPNDAKKKLNETLQLRLNDFQAAEVKMLLADILVYEEKFNQALLYYTQVENEIKNNDVAHQASLKIAQTSYYKGDFEWALKQLSVLKSSHSQLIANDALELHLLISDNTAQDSTQTALKKFAKADYLLFQKKHQPAITLFNEILKEHPEETIIEASLLRLGTTYEKLAQYNEAVNYFQEIINHHKESIYIDEALFYAAEILKTHLNNLELAKEYYEKILFNHQDSIFYIEAQREFRILRGDDL